ncbi:MAG: SDR family oxidoreductase [Burkholderiaceae bacterium]
MGGRVENKSILVTAAAQGMGRESAIVLALEGADVLATDIRTDLLADLSEEAEKRGGRPIRTAALDVTDPAAIKALIEPLPALDVLFNCAGYVHQGGIFDTDPADLERSMAINVYSMFYTIRAALPAMLENGGGSIINMASVCSSVKGLPNRFAYGTTKAAVIGLTKSVAADYVGQGVRCNAVGPGTVETPSLHGRMQELGDVEEARKMFVARQPMGRLAQASEIVPIVIYLASDESVFATGQIFNIDGGISI